MSLEAATYIADLDANNPTPTDFKSQGDDHLRLIKSVLKNTFPGANGANSVVRVVAKNANFNPVLGDDNTTFICDTSGGPLIVTLPTLAPSGVWTIRVQKTTLDANPIFLVPPSGTINGFTKARRSAENLVTTILWNGSSFSASRPFGAPIGSCIEFYGSTLPNGYLWPDGSTFTAADYAELNSVLIGNIKPDRRGRMGVARDDMGGSAAGRVTTAGSGINGVGLGANGGAQNVTLDVTMIPSHNHTLHDPGHHHAITPGIFSAPLGSNITTVLTPSGTTNTGDAFTGVTIDPVGGGLAHTNMPPAIVANFILVAE